MDDHKRIQVIVPPPPQVARSSDRPLMQDGDRGILSFGQALQYTPLNASMLPAHDRIPIPQICRPKESAKLATSSEKKAVQLMLAQPLPTKVQAKLDALLRPDKVAQIQFHQKVHAARAEKPEYTLSPAAAMVLKMATTEYRYLLDSTPIKSSPPISVQQQGLPTPSPITPRVDPPSIKVEILQSPPKVQTPIRSSGSDPRPILVNIPPPPASFRSENYVNVPELSRQRKATQDEIPASVAMRVRSQKEASDAALLNFQNNLMEIFEAQDHLDAGSTNVQETGFFDLLDDGDEAEPRLSIKTLERLQVGLKKLVNLNRLSDMSAEHLRRLQRLCEPAIDRAQTVNLRSPTDDNAEDVEHWRNKIHIAETGLNSSAVCLYTILGCPREESLLFTDARTWIPNVLSNVFESCLIPVIEARQDGQDAGVFSIFSGQRDSLKRLLESGKRLLDIVSTVCAEVQGMDTSVNTVEFLCAKLIFVQNANNDKNSCLGIQVFEKARKVAMSCLARIYARFPGERTTITDEVLSSLDKLPSNSRSARQYRLGNGKNVQLISALFMQLVQTTALELPEHGKSSKRKSASKDVKHIENEDDDDDDDDSVQLKADDIDDAYSGPLIRLQNKATKLFDASAKSAHDIVMYLVARASKTTKSGDSPYRNVLDLFIEDLVTVLPEPEWPSSELILRIMARKMINLVKHDKAAITKNMALESLGVMGSAISTQKSLIPSLSAALEREGRQQSEVTARLCELARDLENGALRGDDLLAIDGPFAVVGRQLWAEASQSLRVRGACGYFLAHFAKLITRDPSMGTVDESDIESQPVRVSNWLLDLIPNVGSDSASSHDFDPINTEDVELAYALCIINVGFCTFFGDIVKTLASSFSSDQAQVRSRSLKSVVAMLETDSSLLDRDHTIAEDVFRCASDDSAMVRDSALSLIARFIISKPGLQQKGIKRLLECASDSKVGVQKRALGHLKDVYISDNRELLKAKIASTFLQRTADPEESVAELSKKTLAEVWIHATIAKLSDPIESKRAVAIEGLSMEIVRCIAHDPADMCPLLQKLLVGVLASEPKGAFKIRDLCSKVVDVLFEKTISGSEEQGPLHCLAAFAAASSQLIQPDRLAKLQSYLGHVRNESDLFMFRSVIGIYSNVLPDLSATQKPLLADIQGSLMKVIPNLGRRSELDPVMMCLRTIDGVLKNTLKLVKFTASVLKGIKGLQNDTAKVSRLLRIGGSIGRCLDLEAYASVFAQELKDFGKGSVASYMANVFLGLTHPSRPFELRALAYESLGSVVQASPVQFNQQQIRKTLFSAFDRSATGGSESEGEQLLLIILRMFDELFSRRAQAKEESDKNGEAEEKQELGKLGGDSKTRDGDSAISFITREVVNHVLEVALRSQGENAFLATRTLASISHEGLIHPKQSTGAFVALGTSPDSRVAQVAHSAHQLLHRTHESVCQREYMQAVHKAFVYQQNVIGDACGGRPGTYAAKLAACFEIVNTSSAKYVKGFLGGLVTRIANDVAIQDKKSHTQEQMLFARFILQNLAFFEYGKMDELLHTILQLELAYSKSGGEVVQLLESSLPQESASLGHEVFTVNGDSLVQEDPAPQQSCGDLQTVRELAPIAATLLMLIETRSYLVRQYAVGRDVRTAISNSKQTKETSKAPVRVHGITGERIWSKTNAIAESLGRESDMIDCCRNFIDLMNVDEDVEVEVDGPTRDLSVSLGPHEMNGYVRGETPGARKRKGSASASNTPAKRPRARAQKEMRRSNSISSMDEAEADAEGDYEG